MRSWLGRRANDDNINMNKNAVAYSISMATHLIAILLGGSISSLMQTDAWPAPAKQLSGLQIVLAIPAKYISAEGYAPGDSVFLYRKIEGSVQSTVAHESCPLESSSFRLLSSGEAVLLAQTASKATPDLITRIRRLTLLASSKVSPRGTQVFKFGGRPANSCSLSRMDDPDVVVGRGL
jgi:hypothetical protein